MTHVRGRAVGLLAGLLLLVGAANAAADDTFRLRFGTLWFLSLQQLEQETSSDTDFLVKRGHLDLFLDLSPWATVRVTPDITMDADGDVDAPFKLVVLRLTRRELGPLRGTFLDLGRAPTPWIGFAESVNRYRLQDGTFLDRLQLTLQLRLAPRPVGSLLARSSG